MTRVIIGDDHVLIREGLRHVLAREADAMYQFLDTRLRIYCRLREPLLDETRRRWSYYESKGKSAEANAETP